MTPRAIIRQAAAEGVRLAPTPAGTVKALGDRAAVERWTPLIREHKSEIVKALREAAKNDTAPANSAMEARRQRVLAMLAEHPSTRHAVLTDTEADPESVILALGARSAMPDGSTVTCELRIPREKYDPFLLLDLVARHGATVH